MKKIDLGVIMDSSHKRDLSPGDHSQKQLLCEIWLKRMQWKGQDEWERDWRKVVSIWCQSGKVGHKQRGDKDDIKFWTPVPWWKCNPYRAVEMISISDSWARPGLLWKSLQDNIGSLSDLFWNLCDYTTREMVPWFSWESRILYHDKISRITMTKVGQKNSETWNTY